VTEATWAHGATESLSRAAAAGWSWRGGRRARDDLACQSPPPPWRRPGSLSHVDHRHSGALADRSTDGIRSAPTGFRNRFGDRMLAEQRPGGAKRPEVDQSPERDLRAARGTRNEARRIAEERHGRHFLGPGTLRNQAAATAVAQGEARCRHWQPATGTFCPDTPGVGIRCGSRLTHPPSAQAVALTPGVFAPEPRGGSGGRLTDSGRLARDAAGRSPQTPELQGRSEARSRRPCCGPGRPNSKPGVYRPSHCRHRRLAKVERGGLGPARARGRSLARSAAQAW
jgi:hypothetical protein